MRLLILILANFRIESSDDGGGVGITIWGVFISANCSIILIIMAFIFILVGAVLTGISHRPRDLGEELEKFLSRQEWGGHLKIIGPIALVIGILMIVLSHDNRFGPLKNKLENNYVALSAA